MKCARCGHDATYPERSGRVCPSCKGKFAFEPREGDLLADMAWKSAIEWVSSGGTVRFTAAHLHHAIARRVKPKGSSIFLLPLLLGLMLAGGAFGADEPGIGMIGVMLAAVVAPLVAAATRMKVRGLTLARADFDQLFARWCETHGKPKGLVAPRASARPPSAAMLRELESYSFDRAVICDAPETVDVLLGNDFHFENNCAVLTVGGYPEHAAPTVRKMLAQNPRLEVFVLHDATVEGCVLAHLLRHDPKWFGGKTAKVYDVALRPGQAAKHPELTWSTPRFVAAHPALGPDEVAWLAKSSMHLAAFSPEQIIKRLFRAMQKLPELASDGGGTSSSSGGDVILWSSDASASDGGGDSFG